VGVDGHAGVKEARRHGVAVAVGRTGEKDGTEESVVCLHEDEKRRLVGVRCLEVG
jgi:hypothetical protein